MIEIRKFRSFRYDETNASIGGYGAGDLTEIRAIIRAQGVVVLEGVFTRSSMHAIRRKAFGYILQNRPSNPPIDESTPNYWRRDDNPPKSAVKRVNQFFSSFYWNDDLAGEKLLMQSMSRLKNEIAGLPAEFALHGIERGYMTYPTITHYPRGGGKLNRHTDPKNIQFCVIICSMSTRGEDYRSGGAYVVHDGEVVDIDDLVNSGDIYLTSPDIVHGVEAIDPDAGAPQWGEEAGRWTLFPSLVEQVTTQGVKVKGLEDLEAGRY
jgi:hypothetical protein